MADEWGDDVDGAQAARRGWGGLARHQPPKCPPGAIQTLAEPRNHGSWRRLSLRVTNRRRHWRLSVLSYPSTGMA